MHDDKLNGTENTNTKEVILLDITRPPTTSYFITQREFALIIMLTFERKMSTVLINEILKIKFSD